MESRQKELQEKLNELKQYEEEQKNSLIMAQKSILTKEQLQMYEILGINVSSFMEIANNCDDLGEIVKSNSEDELSIVQEFEEPVDDSDLEIETEQLDYNNQLVQHDEIVPKSGDFNVEEFKEIGNEQVTKRPFLKRGAGLSNRFKMQPDAFNMKKLPPYKYKERLRQTLAKQKNGQSKGNEVQRKCKPEALGTKNDPVVQKKPETTRKSTETKELSIPQNFNLKIPKVLPIPEKVSTDIIQETPKNPKHPKSASWAQILSSNNIADCSVNLGELLAPTLDEQQDETSIFQLLEAQIKNLNLNSSPSTLLQLLVSLQSEPNSLVQQPSDPIINDAADTINLKIQPHPSDVNKKIIIDDDDDDDEDEEDETVIQEEHRGVRFAENIEIVDDDANSTILSSDLEAVELTQTSTPNERLKFEEFKRKMLGTNVSHQGILEQQAAELKEKTDMMRTKLQEIEKEKSNIIRIRNELELDKIQLENERDDLHERLKDEKIKMEMEIHDERLKIEKQKQKLDKMLRDAKTPSKKEREEVTKLKDALDELKEEMKVKEVRHGSSQARYRSQIKQLEKENQNLKLELEAMKKDNKKLELENARLKRETSTKMLQEINKNIAKLAQPEVQVKKSEAIRRKSEPAKRAVTTKTVQKSSSESEDEELENRDYNPLRTRCSEPTKHSTSSSTDILAEMKREIVNMDGSKDIWYPNGNLKKISADGMLIRMLFYNKDIKETNINEGTVKYYYADNNTWHTTYIDGLEILEYPNGQIEHRYKDDTIEIHYPDGTIKITNKNWTNDVREEWRMPDGTNARIYKNDTRVVSFPNGQREIHTQNHKRREYPDGTVKIVYEDGVSETRYSCGRIRVKDKDGNLVTDSVGK